MLTNGIGKNRGIIAIVIVLVSLSSFYIYFMTGRPPVADEEPETERLKEVIEVPFLEFQGVSIHWLG